MSDDFRQAVADMKFSGFAQVLIQLNDKELDAICLLHEQALAAAVQRARPPELEVIRDDANILAEKWNAGYNCGVEDFFNALAAGEEGTK